MSYRVIVIDESDEDENVLMKNELIDVDLADQIVGIIDDGFVETFEECSTVCDRISEMFEEIGIETDDHEVMLKELEGLKLVRKVVEGNGNEGKRVKKIVKKENGNGKKR